MLTVWGRKTSSNVQALMWCIGELGLTYRRHDVGHRYGGTDTPEFLTMNPNGTIPVLVDEDDRPIWETGAILRYLAARYGSPSIWPAVPADRAKIDMWAEWARLNIALAFTGPVFGATVRTAPSDIDWPVVRRAIGDLSRALDIAEARLARSDFLCGDVITLADIQFGHILFCYFDIGIERRPHPSIHAYYERLSQRPAFREHVMVCYDELRAFVRPIYLSSRYSAATAART
ncbi:glutathione S-transferase family protein [Bradyrhizobium sp. SZCCHNRI20481]|uniref:glutathione S-transferase family protein n=1 Tax=Bradyrhizobium sp. SZCCHNRI20481 TaxID=3057286 RepID=UPI002916B77F|nr:glutathione S-transferase family protein [Bradyrhizobium sp. SZCCHNRI20481]